MTVVSNIPYTIGMPVMVRSITICIKCQFSINILFGYFLDLNNLLVIFNGGLVQCERYFPTHWLACCLWEYGMYDSSIVQFITHHIQCTVIFYKVIVFKYKSVVFTVTVDFPVCLVIGVIKINQVFFP